MSAAVALDIEPIARKRLAARDVAQFEGKAFERRKACGLVVEMTKGEPPTCTLATGMLAHDAIKPALQAAGQPEVVAVNREHQRFVENSFVEPVRYDEIDAVGAPMRIRALRPFVDPREAVRAAFVGLAQRRGDGRRLKAVRAAFSL